MYYLQSSSIQNTPTTRQCQTGNLCWQLLYPSHNEKKIAELEETLNEYLSRLVDLMEGKNLKHDAAKLSYTLFTTWRVEKKTQLNVNIRGVSIPTVPNPKVLGIVLDSSLKFAKQAEEVSKKF